MKAVINLITIWTDDIEPMKSFYTRVLGFDIINDLGNYVEFKNDGARFALCERQVMNDFSGEYRLPVRGQRFELAFPCATVEELDADWKRLIVDGAVPVHPPEDMPWGMRTALFADPDGNIHEIFVRL